MTARIRRLPPEVVDLIAAGEVIERPASAVREMIENALDAGARTVDVRIAAGGVDEIAVVDDGGGIAAEDLPEAVLPHATSKISARDDLEAIASYGFRGEALAALAASCAEGGLEIVSRPRGGEGAALLRRDGRWEVAPVAAAPGTRIVARHLFARSPVRRKFLKSAKVEAAAVSAVVERYALARPDVAFTLAVADGGRAREAFRSSGAGDLRRAAAEAWGETTAASLVEVEGVAGGLRVEGLVGPLEAARPSRTLQAVSVNGRPFRDPVIIGGLAAAFEGLLQRGLHPVALLHVTCPRDFVDTNVHPAKAEIRFREPAAVRDLVRRAVRARMRVQGPVSDWDAASIAPAAATGRYAEVYVRESTASPAGEAQAPSSGEAQASPKGAARMSPDAEAHAAPLDAAAAFRRAAATSAPSAGFPGIPRLSFRGTLGARYLLAEEAENDGALLVVDVHAAHERVLFERLLAGAEEGRPAVQPLLVPFPFEVGAEEAAALEAHRADLETLGIEAEPFGPRTWRVTAVPAALSDGDAVAIVRAVAAALAEGAPEKAMRPARDLIARAACRSAVRTGRRLEAGEAAGLLAALARTAEPGRCPHGRPTIVRLPVAEIDRRFGRS